MNGSLAYRGVRVGLLTTLPALPGTVLVMTSPLTPRNTTAFFAQAALSFGVAAVAVGIGITYLPVDRWIRGFLAVGCLFLVSSSFTLAKCVRDQQDSQSLSRF